MMTVEPKDVEDIDASLLDDAIEGDEGTSPVKEDDVTEPKEE